MRTHDGELEWPDTLATGHPIPADVHWESGRCCLLGQIQRADTYAFQVLVSWFMVYNQKLVTFVCFAHLHLLWFQEVL